MRLHYLVKLKIRVLFAKIQCWKSETKEILLTDFDFACLKRFNILTLTSRYGKFNQENNKTCTKLYQNQPRLVKDMTKTVW